MSNQFDLEDIQEGAERIVSFELSESCEYLMVQEECDSYFATSLTKREARKLIDRLESLHALMVDV